MLISYVVSLLTIGLCLVLKVPQIINLYQVKNANAMSIKSLLLELTSYTTMTCYNYVNGYSPLTYLEYPIILIQELVLIYLVLLYRRLLNKQSIIWTFVYFAVTALFMSKILPPFLLNLLAPLCTPISASSKVIQLMAIVRSGTSQGISAATWFISAFTNLSRAFTIYLDSADSILLCNFGVSTLLSSAVLSATITFSPGSPALERYPPPGFGPTYVAYTSQRPPTKEDGGKKDD